MICIHSIFQNNIPIQLTKINNKRNQILMNALQISSKDITYSIVKQLKNICTIFLSIFINQHYLISNSQKFQLRNMNRNPYKRITTKDAIENIIKYSQSHNNVLQRYGNEFFINYFDHQTIQQLQQKLGSSKKLNKKVFVKQLTSFILHNPDETIFLVMGLIDMFNRIVGELKCENEICIKNFTCHLCKLISNNQSQDTINNKEIPLESINPNPKRVREIDLNPPIIVSHPQKQIPKISKNIKKKQKKVDSSKPLHTFYYNYERKQIITLGRLASHVTIYNLHFQKTGQISPACFKIYDKNMAIMSLAFSEKHQRIGCIISNLGMAFWDYQDNFQTEKFIKKIIGDRIYYLQLLDQWITTDENHIYFWDLKHERVKFQLGEQKAIKINDIKQITHLKCLAVSFTLNDNFKWLYIYENNGLKVSSRLKLSHVGAQKIHYNKCTQTLLLLGMNELPVYLIDKSSLDVSLLKNLSGHNTIITSIADLDEGLIVTGDDRGTMKIWDLKTLRCQQVIKVANTINKIQCIGSTLLYADSRINMLKIQQLSQQLPLSEMYGLKKFYRFESPFYEVYIFTTVSCRIYDLTTGRIKQVIEICINEQQIITVQKLQSDYLISTTKNSLLNYSEDMKLKWKINMNKYHDQEIHHMRSDVKNQFVTTVSKDGTIQVWNQKIFQEGPRKIMQNTLKDYHFEITCFDLSERYSMMVTGQRQPDVKIWDYETCKLCHIIQLESASCAIKISSSYPLMAIACINQKVYLYRFDRNEQFFQLTFIHLVNLRYPQNTLNSLLSLRTFNEIKPTRRVRDELKSIYCNNIIMHHNNKQHSLILAYGKGSVIAFNISQILLQAFRQQIRIKFNLNIQRPIRQTLQKQLKINQYRKTLKVNQTTIPQDFIPVLWNKILHKDTITDLDNFHHQYLSSLSLDGYFKVFTIEKCQVICSLCIRYPLPNTWKLEIFKYEEISKKMYESLKVIYQIFNDKQIQLDKDQLDYKAVSNLMHQMCHHKNEDRHRLKKKTIKLLKDQLKPSDLRNNRNNESQQSLKYLQAYRRVNLIKQIKQVKASADFLENKSRKSSIQQKQHLRKLLSPQYFPNLYARQQNLQVKQKYQQLFAQSTNVSLHHSRQKLSNICDDVIKQVEINKSELQSKRKPIEKEVSKKLHFRSLSQGIYKIFPDKYSLPINQKCSKINQDIKQQLTKNLPLKSLSVFMKNLNEKIPKENQIRKNLKKFSNFNSQI